MTGQADLWLTSAEVRKVLRISTCDLAHLREGGALRAERRGSAYFYAKQDVESLRRDRLKKGMGFCKVDDARD